MAKRHRRTSNVQLVPVPVDLRAYDPRNGPYGQGGQQVYANQATQSATSAGTYRPIQTNPYGNNPALLLNANGRPTPGRRQRNLSTPGMNLTGANQIPVDAVLGLQSGGYSTTFPPGDPVLPTPGMGDGTGGPRAWPYPAGVNIVPQPRATEAIGFPVLRNLSALYEGIQLCEQVYFRILDRLDLQFVPRPSLLKPGESASDDKWKGPALAMQEWFQDGPDRRQDLHGWMKALLRDLLELDAGAIYHRPTRGQGLYSLELVAGETIAALLDVGGRTPEPPYAAYQQVVYGVPGNWFSRDQMDYLRMTARTESPYGRSPVERIILRVNQALRKQSYDLARFTDGATPEGVMQTQNAELAATMTPEKAEEWEAMFNGLLAGNDAARVRTKLVPPGFTFQSTRPEAIATEFDRYLLNVTVAAFGLTMDEVAMTETSNRSVGQSQENVVYRNAVKPVTDYIARYLSGVVRRYDGQPLAPREQTISRPGAATKAKLGKWDARYLAQWGGIEEPEDFTAKATAYSGLVNAGIIGRTEAKRLLKLPVTPDEQAVPPMITAQNGAQSVVIIEDLLKQRDQMLEAQQAALDTQIQTQQAQQEQLKQQQEQAKQLGGLSPEAQQAAQSVQEAQAKGHNVSITTQPNVNVQNLPAGAPQMLPPGAKQVQVKPGAPKPAAKGAVVQSAAGAKPSAQPSVKAGATPPPSGKGAKRDAGRSDLERSSAGPRGASDQAERSAGGWDGEEPAVHGSGADERGPRGDFGAGAGGRATSERASASAAVDTGRSGRAGSGADAGGSGGRAGRGSSGAGGESRSQSGVSGVFGTFRAGTSASGSRAGASGGDASASGAAGSRIVSSVSDEWARWYERALRAAKRGEAQPTFTSALLPRSVAIYVGEALADAYTPEDVRAIFAEARRREAASETANGEPKHSGVMVAFMVPPDVAERLAWDGGEPADELHVTLAFLGDRADMMPRQQERLQAVVREYADEHEPCIIEIKGVGTFPPSPSSDGKTPIFADVDSPALQRWRAGLVDALKAAHLPLDETFKDYHPHITLKYADKSEPLAPPHTVKEAIKGLSFAANRITVALGDEQSDYRVGNDSDFRMPRRADRVVTSSPVLPATGADLMTALLNEMRATRSLVLGALTDQ